MANDDHIAQLMKGVAAWNLWRIDNPSVTPDLSEVDLWQAKLRGVNLSRANIRFARLNKADLFEADLSKADLTNADLWDAELQGARLGGANLSGAHLVSARLREAYLFKADLSKAELRGANLDKAVLTCAELNGANLEYAHLHFADLNGANFRGANLNGAHLCRAELDGADFRGATLSRADLQQSSLVGTNFRGADLTDCRIYGISAWKLKLEGARQQNLVITPEGEPEITVDNIEVAQFIYLLVRNEKVRHVIDTITSKVVLILGRFTPQRKAVLDALREELRRRDYLPILFDFDRPASRDITETISLLARMACFVLADITDATSIPQELNVIVPDLPSVPVQPLLLKENSEYGMFEHYTRYPWVLPLHRYETQDRLITELGKHVIEPAERMAFDLRADTKEAPTLQRKSADEPSRI